MQDRDGLDWDNALDRAYRVAFGVLRDAEGARDVAQQACAKALVNLESFQRRCPFPHWVRSIAFHLALDEVRKQRPWDGDPDELAGGENPEHAAASQESASALHRCLARLTEHQRIIFLAKHLDQMKGAEIAAEMNTAEGTVWATLNQSAKKLRECLDRYGIAPGRLQ